MSLLDILGEEEGANQKDDALPNWVNKDNASLGAYNAINTLKLEKLSYIKKHNNAARYRLKGPYQITQKEVINMISQGRTGVFGAGRNSYSEALNKYLDDINEELEIKKNERIKKVGLRALDKKEVIKKAQNLQQEYDELKDKKLSDFYDDLLKKMPLSDIKKLGLQ
ncbi:hypothetical protein [Paraglaciecola arctica]|uniref:Uncharacterized protein n=1 Tax=Paraglaciecola arctica BSs20135 TaxID=493475 RepID=K6XEF4_9ALTE|nr:hypothetical protein [Paraglaciecola arctica]GAC19019.1 hypothetical protein GARC_2052 [Paraglaciecola arctica BSs20135]|tara:strand:- start:266 stop:766 length:501 start_codon:yes stop_codon:yes gene_type:complete